MTTESLVPRIDRLLADPRLSPEQRREAQALRSKAMARGELTSHEQRVLDRWTGAPDATSARCEGSSLVLSAMSPEAAARRAEEMAAQGLAPKGAAATTARTDPSTFRADQVRR